MSDTSPKNASPSAQMDPDGRSKALKDLRFEAKRLHRAWQAGDPAALTRVRQHAPRRDPKALKRADFLHIIAQENGFRSWPDLTSAAETMGFDRAAQMQRLKRALFEGRNDEVASLLQRTPDLADGHFGLECALYRADAVKKALFHAPDLAVTRFGPRRPILHLAFSKWIHARPDLAPDMLAVAEALVAHGADVNDGFPWGADPDHELSALYGAIGHADNMRLGQWLLDRGADPNDGESLYHATELGHHDGLKMLLKAGARPDGTNALFRAMDFHDHAAVDMLLAHFTDPNDFNGGPVGGEQPWVTPALHQAARRGCDRRMVEMLLDAGADPQRLYKGAHPYAYARAFGSTAVAEALAARGATSTLSPEETLLAQAALGPQGTKVADARVDPGALPEAYRLILREILHLPGRLPQVQRLVALGLPPDLPDSEGLTPVQVAGWEGLPEVMGYFLSLQPDLMHVNAYGGTLLSTVLHGAEHAPDRATRDHLTCLQQVLEAGVPVPPAEIRATGRRDLRHLMEHWVEMYPERGR